MKKILLGGLLGLASLTMAPSAFAGPFGCCVGSAYGCCLGNCFRKCCCKRDCCSVLCLRQYNAFTPVICGNVNCGTGYDVLMPQACTPYYGAGAPGPYVIGGIGALPTPQGYPMAAGPMTPYGPVQSIGYYPGYGYYGVPVMPPYQPVIPIGAAQ